MERGRERNKELVYSPNWLQQPDLDQDKVRSQKLHVGLSHVWRGSKGLDKPLLLSKVQLLLRSWWHNEQPRLKPMFPMWNAGIPSCAATLPTPNLVLVREQAVMQ